MNNMIDPNMAMNAMTDQEMVRRKQQIDALRRQFGDTQSKDEKLRQACEGFESIFIQKMWEQMRGTVPKEGYLHSREEEMYQSMFDQEFAKKMASAGGIGLGDMLYEQLSMKLGDAGRTTSPSTLRDRLPMEPVRMSHMRPKEKIDYTPKLAEAENVINAVAEAAMPRELNTDLYSPLDENFEAEAEDPEHSLVRAALSDFAGIAVLNGAQAELAQASLAKAEANASKLERNGSEPQQPKQPYAVGRVASPRNSIESVRASVSPHERVDVGNISNVEAKDESRILNRAKSVAARTQKSGKKPQVTAKGNYIGSPLPAAYPQAAQEMRAYDQADSPNQAETRSAAYAGQAPAVYGGMEGDGQSMDQAAALGFASGQVPAGQISDGPGSGIQPAVGATIPPPEVRAARQRAAQSAGRNTAQTTGQAIPGSQATGKVVGSFSIPTSAMSPEQAQVAKVEVPAGSRPIVEAPARDAAGRATGFDEQPVRRQSLIEDGAVPAAYGRTGVGATLNPPREVSRSDSQRDSQRDSLAKPAGRQTSQATPTPRTPGHISLADGQGQNSRWPVSGPESVRITSGFGWQNDAAGQKVWNPGVEIAGAQDTVVRAFMDGAVAFAGEHEDYGNLVVLEHGSGLKSYYGNARAQGLQPGDLVKVGTEIAKIDMTTPGGSNNGPADSAYLRFETRRGELAVNPENFISELFS